MSAEEEKNSVCCSGKCWSVLSYLVAVAGAILIVWGLNNMLRHYTVKVEEDNREARGQSRKDERQKIGQAEAAADTYGWANEQKGIVRMPVNRGVELILEEYSNKKTARKNLKARLEKANAKPSKAPEAPSDFE
jgi:hypothetical protein